MLYVQKFRIAPLNPFTRKGRANFLNFYSRSFNKSRATGRLPQNLALYMTGAYIMYKAGFAPSATHEERIASSAFYKKNNGELYANPIYSLPPKEGAHPHGAPPAAHH